MAEFWEEAFRQKAEMWGGQPGISSLRTAQLFAEKGFQKILIPGIGYGRNAQVFLDKGMEVTGIEISATAIELARKQYGDSLKIHHGSVSDMPFDSTRYEGIYSHGLLHLLDEKERKKFIADCYEQLHEKGMMVFTSICKKAPTYGQGKPLGKDRFEQFGGAKVFFYDEDSLREAFSGYNHVHVEEVEENFPFYLIVCEKG